MARYRRQRHRERNGHGDGLTRDAIQCTECPDCGAPRDMACDRSRDPYSARVRDQLQAEGISHYRRMLAAYGVPEFRWDYCVARNTAGAMAGTAESLWELSVELVSCPMHGHPRGSECPGPCPARMRKAAQAAIQRQARKTRAARRDHRRTEPLFPPGPIPWAELGYVPEPV